MRWVSWGRVDEDAACDRLECCLGGFEQSVESRRLSLFRRLGSSQFRYIMDSRSARPVIFVWATVRKASQGGGGMGEARRTASEEREVAGSQDRARPAGNHPAAPRNKGFEEITTLYARGD